MKELNGVLRSRHECVVNLPTDDNAAHRHYAVGHCFGECDHIGHDTEALRPEVLAQPPEACDHLIKDEEYPVAGADLAEALEVTDGWDDNACGALSGLDDNGRDRRGVVQRYQIFKFVREMRTPSWLAAREVHPGLLVGMRKMIYAV